MVWRGCFAQAGRLRHEKRGRSPVCFELPVIYLISPSRFADTR
jgi:hypothetical protein